MYNFFHILIIVIDLTRLMGIRTKVDNVYVDNTDKLLRTKRRVSWPPPTTPSPFCWWRYT